MNDAPGRYANDDNIRSNLRAHEESVADMLHHARVDARGEYPRSRRLRCFQEATFEHLTEPGLQFEILYTTMNTDNLDREAKSRFSLCAADVWCRAYEIGQLQSPLLGEQMRDLRRIGIVRQAKIMRFGRMQHVLEFDDPVGIGWIERGVFGHVPAFEIVLGVIVRWIGEKQFRWHAFESTIGWFHRREWTMFDTLVVFRLRSAAEATRRIVGGRNELLAPSSKEDHAEIGIIHRSLGQSEVSCRSSLINPC